jgi:hypothetical protein
MKHSRNSLGGLFGLFSVLCLTLFLGPSAKAQAIFGNIGSTGNVVSSGVPGQVVTQTNYYAAYLTGTAYTLTGTNAAVVGGTTSQSITIPAPGTYFIYGDADVNLVGATFSGGQTLTLQLYRTNNTPGALTGSSAVLTFGAVTTVTQSAGTPNVHGVIYTTTNSNDIVTVYGVLSATPSAGSVTVTGGGLYALRLY